MRKYLLLLFLAFYFFTGIFAQSPGGVASPELWFQTRPMGFNLNSYYHWVDYSGDSLRLNVYDSGGATFGEEYTTTTIRSYNGHPAISLDKLLDTKTRDVLLKRTNLSQATILGMFAPSTNFSSEMMLFGLNGRPGQGVWVSNDKVYPSRESRKDIFNYGENEGMDLMYSSNDSESNESDFHEQSARIIAYYRSLPPSTGIWGERDKAVFTFGYYKSNSANNSSSFNIPLAANRQFVGYVPEFIAYNRLLNPLERRQVDSYLAIKYGLTIPVSYMGSSGQLLWDYYENPEFNHRVTAIYRDNISGLYQGESSTSYEEAPNFSDQLLNDYYYNNNPNNRTSNTRLLSIARQYGNKLSDGSYMFWGDNDASINIREIEGTLGMKIMDRKWLFKTNITPTPDAEKILEWDIYDLDIQTSGFISNVTKSSNSSSPELGVAYTKKPLNDINGYLSLDDINLFGGIYMKFGSNQAITTIGSHDYGYFISGDNKVYTIVKGEVSTESFTTLVLTNRLEMEKHGNRIFLRLNGTRHNNSEIVIDKNDENKSFYGAVAMTKGLFDGKFNLRHGGFVDTGNRVELSYTKYRANEFKDNKKGKSYLVIDRSGTGNFNPSDVEYIMLDEIDSSREKAIFNNVFFDTDGNGSDVFTFAYQESDISGDIEVIDPECNKENGEVKIKLTSGKRAFKYTLTDMESGEVIKEGRENSYTIHLTGLPSGDYELKIEEAGGFNVIGENNSGTPTRAKTTNFFPVFEGSLEWMITNTTDTYMIGYTNFVEDINNPKNIIHYGLKKQGNVIYKIVSGKLENTNVTVEMGDVIKIAKTMNKVYYYKNGIEFSSNSIKWYDIALKFYGLIDMSEGPAEILNVNATGFFNLADYNWNTMDGIDLSHSNNATLTYQFSLEDPCGPQDLSTPIQPENSTNNNSRLTVTALPGTYSIKAVLTSENPETVTFVVYDLNGNLSSKVNNSTPVTNQEANLNVSRGGVYIIKAITANGEYSQKIIVQ